MMAIYRIKGYFKVNKYIFTCKLQALKRVYDGLVYVKFR